RLLLEPAPQILPRRLRDPAQRAMTSLRRTLHLPAAPPLLADLAHILPADAKPFGQLALRPLLALVRLQNPTTQVIRHGLGHGSSVAEQLANTSLSILPTSGYNYLGTALTIGSTRSPNADDK